MKRAQQPMQLVRLLVVSALLLGVFIVYAPSVRLMLFHDDALNILWMNGSNLLTIFAIDGKTGASARPVANALWILIRDLFGWYVPGLIHMLNVWLHVLNVALVSALAGRLGRFFGLPGAAFQVICALIFGLFPFSYQAILWAGAIYHPVMASCGLLAILAYLGARQRQGIAPWLLSALLLLAACLSHESGFVYGILILGLELIHVGVGKQRLRRGAVALCCVSAVYLIAYRLMLPDMWSLPETGLGRIPQAQLVSNVVYFMQAMVSWLLILARFRLGLTDASPVIILAAFTVSVALALVLFLRRRAFLLGSFALAWWALAIAPAALLTSYYVVISPRLMYVSSVGIALFWGGATAVLLRALRRPILQFLLLGPVAILLGWCVPYIADRMNETARLTPALHLIDADLRASSPDAKVLLINLPWWSAPAYPAFLIGAEGMPIFQHGGAPAWSWAAAVSGVRRDTSYVLHEISLTRGDRYTYGIPGANVNDAGLRAAIEGANYIYRFDYDAPGLRVKRLAVLGNDPTVSTPLAWLTKGTAQASLRAARAAKCGDNVVVDLAWSDVRGMSQPVGVFVHVYDEQGRQAIVADKDLVDGYLPLDQVPAGVVISETRAITIPATVATVKEVQVGAYRRTDGQRLQAVRADGGPWEGDAVVIPIDPAGGDLCARASDWPVGPKLTSK